MRKRKFRLAFTILPLAVLGGLAWFVLSPREPAYKGRPISTWLNDVLSTNETKRTSANTALQEIGTNIVPVMHEMILSRDSPLKLKLMALAKRQSVIKFHLKTARQHHLEAMRICFLLEPPVRAQLAGDWIKLIERGERVGKDTEMEELAAAALEPLMTALTNNNPHVRSFASEALQWRPADKTVVHALLERLSDTDDVVRMSAAGSLGLFCQEPDMVVPALLLRVADPDPLVRCCSIEALAGFTNQAPVIVPHFLKSLTDQDKRVREASLNAMKKIDPEAAAKAGIK